MRIVVIGGTGFIGSKLVRKLTEHGQYAIAAAPATGVNTLTGVGLAEVLRGADVLVDVSNSPSFEESSVVDFFAQSTRNLLSCSAKAGIKHYVALSVVGTQHLSESPYFRAKLAQEKLIEHGSIPYTIIASTQFFESVNSIADAGMVDGVVRKVKGRGVIARRSSRSSSRCARCCETSSRTGG